MRVTLYRPFGDPWRQSMRVYDEQLRAHLPAHLLPGDTLTPTALENARLQPPARYWDQYVRYQRLAARTPGDVHHILDHGYAHLASALPKGRVVVTFHDAVPLRSGLASLGTRLTLTRGMRRAIAGKARFITGSEASRRDGRDFFGVDPAHVTIVPYGVDARCAPATDRDALRARLGLTRPVALIVGHTQPYMNVEGALRAAAHAGAHVDLEVVKIGAPLTVTQRRLAERALGSRLRELGIVSDDDVRAWYAAADVLVYLPSLSGFGLPVLEAMASGLPVVTASRGAVPEIAAGAAALVDPEDAAAAGDAIARVLTDDEARGALVRRGLARAAGYSWRRTAEETMRVYRLVADAA